jgi:hypothetical protein
MAALMDKILIKLETTIADIKNILKPTSIKSANSTNPKFKALSQEFEALQYQIDKIVSTTATLLELKQTWIAELNEYNLANEDYIKLGNVATENSHRDYKPDKENNVKSHDKSEISDSRSSLLRPDSNLCKEGRCKSVNQKQSKTQPKQNHRYHADNNSFQAPHSSKNTIETILFEFNEAKSTVNKLKTAFAEHKHFQYEEKMNKLSNGLLKLESEHGIIQNEMSELLHAVHKLTQRVEHLEDDSIKNRVNKAKNQDTHTENIPYLTHRNQVEEKPTFTDAKMYAEQFREANIERAVKNNGQPFLISHRTKPIEDTHLSDWAKRRIESESIQTYA